MKDLTPLAQDIIKVIELHFPDQHPAVGLVFTLKDENYKDAHWVTNMSREDGIVLFNNTAEKMKRMNNKN